MDNPLTDAVRTRNVDQRIVLGYLVDIEAGATAAEKPDGELELTTEEVSP